MIREIQILESPISGLLMGILVLGRLVAWMSFLRIIASLLILILLIVFLIGKHLFGFHHLVLQWQRITLGHLMLS